MVTDGKCVSKPKPDITDSSIVPFNWIKRRQIIDDVLLAEPENLTWLEYKPGDFSRALSNVLTIHIFQNCNCLIQEI